MAYTEEVLKDKEYRERVKKQAKDILWNVRTGQHKKKTGHDIRDAGVALNGEFDQDFPTALLALAANFDDSHL